MGAHFNFEPVNLVASDYTERQLAILNDDIPLESVKTTELAIIMKKAQFHGDVDSYEIAKGFYEAKRNPTTYTPSYKEGEAREILQSLTPWKINWDV